MTMGIGGGWNDPESALPDAAARLAEHWPAVGERDEAAKDLAGMLLRGGWSEEMVNDFVKEVARSAGDEEWRQRGKARTTARKLAEGGHVTGAPSLARRLTGDGERVVAQVRKWLELSEPRGPANGRLAQSTSREQSIEMMMIDGKTLPWSVLASDVEEKQISWLWQGRIPLGAITLLDGDPGLGKSLISIDLAARVTTGRDMPDGTPGVDGGVVLLSAEDDLAATVRPRLEAASAYLDRVEMLRGVTLYDLDTGTEQQRFLFLPQDIPYLERVIGQVEARLVVIDPLMAYLDSTVNSWSDQHVRAAFAPLTALAERTGAAILILRHLNKATGMSALHRGGGSIGIVAAARSGLLVAKHPDNPEDERILASTKSNLGPPLPSLRYCITASDDDDDIPQVEWLGECPLSAEQALAAPQGKDNTARPSKVAEALEWLHAKLATGPLLSRLVEKEARAAGISEATLRRARTQLGVRIQRRGFGADLYTWWILAESEIEIDGKRLTPEDGRTLISYRASDLIPPILLKSSSSAQPEIMSSTDEDEQN